MNFVVLAQLGIAQADRDLDEVFTFARVDPVTYIQSAPNSSRVARTLPLSMSLLAQSGIEHMRESDTRFL